MLGLLVVACLAANTPAPTYPMSRPAEDPDKSPAQVATKPDISGFVGFPWGTRRTEVMRVVKSGIEDATSVRRVEYLRTRVHHFSANRLDRYEDTHPPMEHSTLVADYWKKQREMVAKLGAPTAGPTETFLEPPAASTETKGQMALRGAMKIEASWDLGETTASHTLARGDDLTTQEQILVSVKSLPPLEPKPKGSGEGYQSFAWGANPSDVQDECPGTTTSSDYLFDETAVGDFPVHRHFQFMDGGLARVLLSFDGQSDIDKVLERVETLRTALNSKYGKPIKTVEKKAWSKSVVLGDGILFKWRNKETEIVMECYRKGLDLLTFVQYTGLKAKPSLDALEKKAEKDSTNRAGKDL